MNKAQAVKRALLGRTMATGELRHTFLPKVLALPVFSSDPLSSNAYATQEILLVLAIAGAGTLSLVVPLTFFVAILLATVVVSYRQTVRAYPSGGGAYIVSHENLGMYPGLLAAAALLIDYVLTVSVSITAGVDAIVSVAPSLSNVRISIAIGFVAFVTLVNLRGAKESGTLFAIPTYGFVASIFIMLGTGFIKCLDGCPVAESAGTHIESEEALTVFLLLRAFAAGTTALTGVEAISNGVPAFRFPQSKNAATTLGIMGVMSISMFIGISLLANQTRVVATEEGGRTVVAEIAAAVFGGGYMFYVVQIMTAGILILAANTAYQDFPRLSSILAQDRFMPRQFISRGDRLVFSNGILILAILASILIVIFDANLTQLIQLYLVGVFISFTLSQTGMVVHWRRTREPGWRRRVLINGYGATFTAVTFVVVSVTKFVHGAWIVLTATPLLIILMRAIHRHYKGVAEQLAHPDRAPLRRRAGEHRMVILITSFSPATARAVGYVRSVRPGDVTALTFDEGQSTAWRRLAPEIPLVVAEVRGSLSESVKSYLRDRRKGLTRHDFLTIVVPELLEGRGLLEILKHPRIYRLKASLLAEPGVQVLDIPILSEEIDPEADQALEPVRHYAVVLVAGVHNATLEAIAYAETLRPIDLRAVSFGLDPSDTERLGDQWLRARVPLPLELEDSPFRDLGESLTRYVRQFRPDGVERVVTVILPEFVVPKARHRLLHGQTALVVKRHLLFERGVVVASVPYHLER
jgi:amino acid transporter